MPNRRLRVAVIFGGRSGEHEVSIQSARSVIDAIDRDRYDVVPIGITHGGAWISASPAAVIPGHRESYLVRMAEAVHRVMGFDPPITNAGSNNSSAALQEGISSISTGNNGSLPGLLPVPCSRSATPRP